MECVIYMGDKTVGLILVVFTFVLVSKGWHGYDVQPIIDKIKLEAPSIKGIYFYDRPGICEAYYSVADTITFYDKWLDTDRQLELVDHELCHRTQYLRSHVLNHVECPI